MTTSEKILTSCYTTFGLEEVDAVVDLSMGKIVSSVERLRYVFRSKAQEDRRREFLKAHPMYKHNVENLMHRAVVEDQLVHLYNDMIVFNGILTQMKEDIEDLKTQARIQENNGRLILELNSQLGIIGNRIQEVADKIKLDDSSDE